MDRLILRPTLEHSSSSVRVNIETNGGHPRILEISDGKLLDTIKGHL